MRSSSPSFRWRSFVTCSLAASFVVAGLSGIVLFVRPEGSLARWVGWSVLGADKGQWEALHVASVVLLMVVSAAHLWLNWRPFASAVLDRLARLPGALRPRRELGAAVALVALVTLASLANWQPFAAVNDLRASIKDGRFVVSTPPPAANADRMTVAALCDRLEIAPAQAAGNARRRGIVIADSSKTLGGIAEELGLSPEEVFEALAGDPERRVQP